MTSYILKKVMGRWIVIPDRKKQKKRFREK